MIDHEDGDRQKEGKEEVERGGLPGGLSAWSDCRRASSSWSCCAMASSASASVSLFYYAFSCVRVVVSLW